MELYFIYEMACPIRSRIRKLAPGARGGIKKAIFAHAALLEQFGPGLGRPRVDTLQGSKLPNLKELRVQYQGSPWRVLFVFDPKRQAILLLGGNKQGDARWYKKAIPLAEERYHRHLNIMEKNYE